MPSISVGLIAEHGYGGSGVCLLANHKIEGEGEVGQAVVRSTAVSHRPCRAQPRYLLL